jgi:hypothetical protein
MQIEARNFEGERDEEVARKATASRYASSFAFATIYTFIYSVCVSVLHSNGIAVRSLRGVSGCECRIKLPMVQGLLKIVIDEARSRARLGII